MALACSNHPNTPAGYTCFDCHGALCDACIRTRDDGMIVCPSCLAGEIPLADEPRGGPAAEVPSGPPAYPCIGHPEVPAVIGCSVCRGLICATCDFVFDDLHLCPPCAALTKQAMTPQRKKMAMWGLVLACVSVPVSIVGFLIVRIAPEMERGDQGAAVAVNLLMNVVMVVCIGAPTMGFLLGLYAFHRKSVNPGYLWIAPIGNGLIATFWILLLLVGMFALVQR